MIRIRVRFDPIRVDLIGFDFGSIRFDSNPIRIRSDSLYSIGFDSDLIRFDFISLRPDSIRSDLNPLGFNSDSV